MWSSAGNSPSLLGPLLFIFFINDLLNININSNKEFISFADDTAILISEPTVNSLYHEANILNNVYAWFCKNKLKLNLLKSKFICFNLSVTNVLHEHNLIVHSLNCNPNLNRCDPKCVKLEKVNELKYLGLIIDYRLRWDSQVNYINSILRKFFYVFNEARHILDVNYKRVIYLALVQSVFSYGISIWGSAFNNILHKLQ